MSPNVLARCIPVVLALAIVAGGVVVVLDAYERQRLRAARLHMTRDEYATTPGQRADGVETNGVRVAIDPRAALVAVRYASRGCPYCLRDKEWSVLADEMSRRHVPVLVVLPHARDAFAADTLVPLDAIEMAYVNVGWIKRYRLTGTPTLLLLDASGSLIWHHEGILTATDRREAVTVIKSLKTGDR